MKKKKMEAEVRVADGSGGMRRIQDLRFEKDAWPLRIEIPEDLSDTWQQYLATECDRRHWQCASMAQLDAQQNSGTISIHLDAVSGRGIDVIWERRRGKVMKVKARTTGGVEHTEARDLFTAVSQACEAGATADFFFRRQLEYDGLPWKGELWLADKIRLGPPSQFYEEAILGPRVVIVDTVIAGVNFSDAAGHCQVLLRQLSAFLSIVMRKSIELPDTSSPIWTWSTKEDGTIVSATRCRGYQEVVFPGVMPAKGRAPEVPLRSVSRPELDLRGAGLHSTDTEQWVPADIVTLWNAFLGLTPDLRRQFLEAATAWQLAASLGQDWETARYALMVVACEALKPLGGKFDGCNIYDVFEGLLGIVHTKAIREKSIHPQAVRNQHFHRARQFGNEFSPRRFNSSFEDPSFREAADVLWISSAAAIVEWLGPGARSSIRARRVRSLARAPWLWYAIIAFTAGTWAGWVLKTPMGW